MKRSSKSTKKSFTSGKRGGKKKDDRREKGVFPSKYDLITIGSGLVDNLIYTGTEEKNGKISFPSGSKIRINNIEFNTGGGGTNTAVCASLLGLKAGFMGKIGQGNNADIIKRELKKNKVDFIGAEGKTHTGYSAILETKNEDRTILTYKGASDTLKFSELKKSKIDTKWIHFTSMRGDAFETQLQVAEYAKKQGIKLSYNPSSYQIKDKISKVKKLLKKIDVLSLNKEEAKLLTKETKENKIINSLLNLGPKIVCITNGSSEGLVSNGIKIYKFQPPKIKVKECTGAGDTFAASFITGIIKNKTIEECISIALTNTSSLIQKEGAKSGLLTWNKLQKQLRKIKITKPDLN
ncbi:MAG: carbohydrate kinase family protein [Candidatus Pacearchaeota archaeon]